MSERVLGALVALWGVEVALARVTGVALGWEILGVLGVYLGFWVVGWWLPRVAVLVPLGVVLVGILGPMSSGWGGLGWGVVVLGMVGFWWVESRIPNLESRIPNPDQEGPAQGGGAEGLDYEVLAIRDSSEAPFEIRDSRFDRSVTSTFTAATVALTACIAWTLDGATSWAAIAAFLAITITFGVLTRRMTGIACVIVTGLVLGLWPSTPPKTVLSTGAATGPDIVLITVDTLRADTPLKNATQIGPVTAIQAASPWTLPSMVSIMSGLPVAEHRAGRLGDGGYGGMRDTYPTLAEQLKTAGYATAAVAAPNPFVGREFGFDRGFDHFDHLREETEGGLPRGEYRGSPGRLSLARLLTKWGLWPAPGWGGGEDVVARVSPVLEAADGQALFLWVHLLDPHLPYTNAMSLERSWRERVWLTSATRREVLSDPEVDRSLLLDGYLNEVARTDAALGQLLDQLGPAPERGRIIALVADHGEAFWEHDDFEHGHAFWQEVVAVPFALSVPNDIGGQIEIADALLALATERALPEPAAAHYVSENLMHGGAPFAAWSVLEGTTKAIFHESASDQLFNLATDPGERSNLATTSILDRLRETPHGWPDETAPLSLDPDATDQLKALGYME